MKRLTKIDITSSIIILSVAFMVDLVEVILTIFAVGTAIEIISGIFQYGVFGLYFYFHGSNFFMKKSTPKPNIGKVAGSEKSEMKVSAKQICAVIFESVPVVGALPIFTLSIASKILEVNKAVREQEASGRNENIIRMSTNNTEKNPNILQFSKSTTPQNQPGAPAKDQNSNVIRLKNENNMKKAA